ncbi:hypothetical protein ATEIFO6365_0011035700 [Aspergillus terreus]|uniref:Uncharacterized protein n=1 Tax=Aspergillus terreus TaxID=33178 RepID=A0A5M3YZC5_ASPTE|nr:hypothetical protein ATETN484_0006049900 [Aspergillus terreus]GFF20095.1 hypothetical protein ATEIFO6365_0011035700 [Aspergillus terreus]
MAPSQTPSPARAAHTPSSRTSLEITPDFTDPSFDPADFLNDVLPPLTLASSQSLAPRGPGAVSLPELSSQVQSILTQINAQNVRHSNTLTQLTDEILRSGSRLAYEVEVLRGETIGLSETLTEALRDDIAKFVPDAPSATTATDDTPSAGDETDKHNEPGTDAAAAQDPDYITKLRTLNQVRSRLEEVVQTFGDAMEWPLPPSETSLTSSFISVSAPEAGPESHSREEKGQEVAKKLRNEVTELLNSHSGGQQGLEAAAQRVEALRVLATLWKGTAEEKARVRFVDGLSKMVEERRRALEDQGRTAQSQQQRQWGGGHRRQESEGPGGGIFKNLQRLREEIYLE